VMVDDLTTDVMPPPWLSVEYSRRWHELFIRRPVDPVDTELVELVRGVCRELTAVFCAAMEA